MTGTDKTPRDLAVEYRGTLEGGIIYRLGYATELIRQIVAHHTRGDEAALSHSVEVARRFLTQGPDR